MEDKPMNTATKEFDTKVSRAIDRAVDDIRTTFDRSTRDALVKRINVKLAKRGQKLKISRKAFDATPWASANSVVGPLSASPFTFSETLYRLILVYALNSLTLLLLRRNGG